MNLFPKALLMLPAGPKSASSNHISAHVPSFHLGLIITTKKSSENKDILRKQTNVIKKELEESWL